jgi:hypothetical protein
MNLDLVPATLEDSDGRGWLCPRCLGWVAEEATFTFNTVEYLIHNCPTTEERNGT